MPHRYPQEAALNDGRRILIRPFESRDTDALYRFFQELPEDSRRFAWDRIWDRGLVETWGLNVDYSKVFPLLALEGTRIVADASLHCRNAGPLRLVGRIKWLIADGYHNVGLGLLLINHFIDTARERGLRHLTCMLISDLEAEAISTLERLGFRSYRIEGYGTDPDGAQHDMTKMILKL
jgi:GNAT superfamily N-acetyltransferase